MPPLNPTDGPRRSLESSQLSAREKRQIIENPFENGYSYADSFSYKKGGSIDYENPRLCRKHPPTSSKVNIFTKTEQKLASFSKEVYLITLLCVSLLLFSFFLHYYFPNCDEILKKKENKLIKKQQKEIQNKIQKSFPIKLFNYKEKKQKDVNLFVQPVNSVVLFKGNEMSVRNSPKIIKINVDKNITTSIVFTTKILNVTKLNSEHFGICRWEKNVFPLIPLPIQKLNIERNKNFISILKLTTKEITIWNKTILEKSEISTELHKTTSSINSILINIRITFRLCKIKIDLNFFKSLFNNYEGNCLTFLFKFTLPKYFYWNPIFGKN